LTARTTRDDIDRTSIASYTDLRNCCGAVAFFNFSNIDANRCGVFFFDARTCCGVADGSASRLLALLRQHFLKREAVFLNVLVYSRGSAFRFPSARDD
jgi:hypothetical protein